MTQLLAALLIALGASGFFLFKSIRANGELREQIHTVEQERDDAREDVVRLTEAGREHAKELAAARRRAADSAREVAKVADDGCLDRTLPAPVLDALRMYPGEEGREHPAASAPSRPAPHATVHR